MNDKEMVNEWLKHNKIKVDNTPPLNRDTISIDFNGNIKRKQTVRKTALLQKVLK